MTSRLERMFEFFDAFFFSSSARQREPSEKSWTKLPTTTPSETSANTNNKVAAANQVDSVVMVALVVVMVASADAAKQLPIPAYLLTKHNTAISTLIHSTQPMLHLNNNNNNYINRTKIY